MLKNALPLVTPSGFVAFDGGAIAPDAYRVAGKGPSVLMPLLDEPAPAAAPGMPQAAVWEPAIGRRARWVEGALVAAICGYFVFGFLNMLRGF